MIAVVHEFSKMPREVLDGSRRVPLTDPSLALLPTPSALAVYAVGTVGGLDYQGKAGGAHLVVETSGQVPRRHLYAIAPVDDVLRGAAALAVGINDRHGAGRWWSTGNAVLYIWQREGVARIATVEGVPHVVLAAYYFWAPPVERRPYAPGEKMTDRHPDSVIAQVVEETIAKHNLDRAKSLATPIGDIQAKWRQFDQDFPAGEPKLGDLVRWWPQVTVLGTPAERAEWIDGLVTGRYHDGRFDIRVTARSSPSDEGPEIQTEPGTLVRRHRKPYAPLPAKLQKSAPAQPGKQWVTPVICEQPGYNAVFHIDPDPPDLAQRQAARVAEHQRREAQAMARPDGFDQRAVDAARAALLAPAPPRYPRTR